MAADGGFRLRSGAVIPDPRSNIAPSAEDVTDGALGHCGKMPIGMSRRFPDRLEPCRLVSRDGGLEDLFDGEAEGTVLLLHRELQQKCGIDVERPGQCRDPVERHSARTGLDHRQHVH